VVTVAATANVCGIDRQVAVALVDSEQGWQSSVMEKNNILVRKPNLN
jgi:hydrogenase maturation factor